MYISFNWKTASVVQSTQEDEGNVTGREHGFFSVLQTLFLAFYYCSEQLPSGTPPRYTW